MHTALHGHIKYICYKSKISYRKNPKLKPLFANLCDNHPAFKSSGPRAQDVERILDSLADIVDALGPIRNRASLSHPPEEDLLDETEATLAVNALTTIFNYVDQKIQNFDDSPRSSIDEIPF